MQEPNTDVLARFGARVVEQLGGRERRHWVVVVDGGRFVLQAWTASPSDVDYELRLMARIAELGWPVAAPVSNPVTAGGDVWCLFSFVEGEPPSTDDAAVDARARGRLLAEFHNSVGELAGFGQREGWRRCEEILADTAIDDRLAAEERAHPEEVRVLRWHLERARRRLETIDAHSRPALMIHGDFAPWNLRFVGDRLTGILDFEMSHPDHRVAEFALSWRGKHDDVIRGYDEVLPLSDEDWALLTPSWWAWLLEGLCVKTSGWDDGWTMNHLIRRSPLMGPDATERA